MALLEERIEKWIWPTLGVLVMLVAAVLIIWFPAPKWGEAPEIMRQAKPVSQPDSSQDILTIKDQKGLLEGELEGQNLRAPYRDPFLSKAELKWLHFLEEVSMRPPLVEGIMEREGQRFAFIKGMLWKAGDEIEGFSIVRVGQEEVELSKEGKRVVVKLKPGGLK